MKGGNIWENIPGVSRFRTNESEGESCELAMLKQQLSCTKFFHPSYGLFYINFKNI